MINRSAFVKVAAAACVALVALGTASVAQAGGNMVFSLGANIAPGVTLGISNAPHYAAPVYYPQAVYQSAPVYYQPASVYYEPVPVYYQPAVYVAPRVVDARPYAYPYGYGHGYRRHHGHGHGR